TGLNNSKVESLNYSTQNIEKRVNLGNPGTKGNRSSYQTGKIVGGQPQGALDKINALPLYKSQYVVTDKIKNDLVKFRIGVIDNNNPKKKTYIHFRAFLGGFSDNYSATWNPLNYLGRGEKLYTYSGFDRQVSLSWTVAAQSKKELEPMYQKLNYLASSLAPDYTGNGFMKGNLAELTVGGYFYNQPGIITSMNLSISDDTPYEIAINDLGKQDRTLPELPMIVRVDNFNFIPIHNFRPALQDNAYGTAEEVYGDVNGFGDERFIALNGDKMKESLYGSSGLRDSLRQQQAAAEQERQKQATEAETQNAAARFIESLDNGLDETGETFDVSRIA
ncbi:MAG: hypothetical protein ACPGDB_04585, partial [Fusobacterium sp.]